MAYQIRPLSFGEILDRAFRVLVDNADILILISAIVWIPERFIASIGPAFQIIVGLIMMVAIPFLQAAVTIAVADIYLERRMTIEKAYRSAREIFLPFVGTYLLFYLPVFALAIPAGLIGYLAATGNSSFGVVGVITLVVFVPAMYLMNRWSLIGPIMVVERQFGTAALRRSGALVNGVWWRTFGIAAAAGLIVQVPVGILTLIWHSIPILGTLLSALATSVTWAYSITVIVIYYFDRRCRVEDFDLLRLADQIRSEYPVVNPATPGTTSVG